jgi:hypothetical protein
MLNDRQDASEHSSTSLPCLKFNWFVAYIRALQDASLKTKAI